MQARVESEGVKHGLPPVAGPDPRLFILGSLPGDASLLAREYYAHPQNQFWRLLGMVTGEHLQCLPYEVRLQRLAARRIGLWDVIGSAVRQGSLDQAIRSANHNRIQQLLDDYPGLEAIAFNGSTASSIGRRTMGEQKHVALIDLPSSSPANTRPFRDKTAAWLRLASYIDAAPCLAPGTGRHG